MSREIDMNLMTNVYDRQKGLLRRKGGCHVMSCWSNSVSVLHPTYPSYKNQGKVNQSTFSCLYFLLELGFIIHVKKKCIGVIVNALRSVARPSHP